LFPNIWTVPPCNSNIKVTNSLFTSRPQH
jgi:hypothetical protein